MRNCGADILTALTGVVWEEAWERRVQVNHLGMVVWFISRVDYVANKKAVEIPKDIADLDAIGEPVR